jgi:hypothetical protein
MTEDIFEIAAAQTRAENDAWEAGGGPARVEQKRARERAALVRQGIIDENGDSLIPETEDGLEFDEDLDAWSADADHQRRTGC